MDNSGKIVFCSWFKIGYEIEQEIDKWWNNDRLINETIFL